MSKSQLLETLKRKRHHWDMMLNAIDRTRMDEPGAAAGVEPETEFMPVLLIQDLDWFDLRDPAAWRPKNELGIITFPWLEKLRAELGYG